MKSVTAMTLGAVALLVGGVIGVGALLSGPSAGADLGRPVDVGSTDGSTPSPGVTSPGDHTTEPTPDPSPTQTPSAPPPRDRDDDDDDSPGEPVEPASPITPDDDDDDDDRDDDDDDDDRDDDDHRDDDD